MRPGGATIRVVDASAAPALDLVKDLFRGYAREWAATIAETLATQGFEAELVGLPGRYEPPAGCLLLAMDQDAPVGCVAMRELGAGTCEMKRLYVAPEARGRGLGKILVVEVLRRAELAGHRRMVLDTMPEMGGAVALYRACGFNDAERYWDHPVEQAIFLEKTLGAAGPVGNGAGYDAD